MSRDLLYKPQVPILLPDEEDQSKKVGKTDAKKLDIGVKGPSGRDIGGTHENTATPGSTGPAFKNPYFTQDTRQVYAPNMRSSTMQALRGGEGVTDLKKVVLPLSPMGIDTPNAAQLRDAGNLMQIEDASMSQDLASLVSRQGMWAQAKGMTVEMLEARLRHLEQMVADRKLALARFLKLPTERLSQSATLQNGAVTEKHGAQEVDDIASAGTQLVQENLGRADGMHKRIAKTLGIKRSK